MSIDAIIKKMSEDEKFAEKYAKFDNLDAVLEQAKADGYSITKEDIEKYIASHKSGRGERQATKQVGWWQGKQESMVCRRYDRFAGNRYDRRRLPDL